VHFVPNLLAASRFVHPLVLALRREGIHAEIWAEMSAYDYLAGRLNCPLKWRRFSLRPNLLGMVVSLVRLWIDFKKIRPTGIEAHFTRGALIPLLAAKFAGIRVRIYHNHGVPYLGYVGVFRFALKLLEIANIRCASHVITVSPGMCRAYVHDGLLRGSACSVLGPGSACGLNLSDYALSALPDDKIAKKNELGLDPYFVVMYVGRPHRRKGFHFLLYAWNHNFSGSLNMRLFLAGVTSNEVERVLRGKMPTNMKALGYVEDLRSYYAAADVVVLPSTHEGFGYALLEGAASGCCLIASDILGPDAIVKHEVNGYIVALGDEHDLVARISELRDEPQKRSLMSIFARESAKAFDRSLIVADYLKFIYSLLKA